VVHGGLKPWMVGRADMGRRKGPIASICLYGEADGFLQDGRPNRLDFTRDWDLADVTLVYGHQVFDEVRVSGPHGTCNGIDTGCAFGGALTALRWPQQELVQVQALADYDAEQVPA
jgi:protein phosphatase